MSTLQPSFEDPLRIMHLASGDLWAGAEVQVYSLLRALKERPEVSVEAVLFNHGALERKLTEAGIPVQVFDESRLNGLKLLMALGRHFRLRQPEILHTHGYKENVLGSIAAIACSGLRSVRTVHGGAEFKVNPLNILKSGPQLLDRVCAIYLQRKIICVSAKLFDDLSVTFPASRLALVENGIDFDEVVRSGAGEVSLPAASAAVKVGFLGRFVPVKRLDLVVEIARLLHDAHPGRYAFYLFGEGPLEEQVKNLIRSSGLEQVVHLMGFVAQPAPCLAKMDILLMTSDHEGLPMTVLEALCLKVRVVSHDVGAIAKVVGDGRYGDLVESQDPHAYVRAIESFEKSSEQSRQQANDGQAHVARNFSVRQKCQDYLEIYYGIAARNGGSASAHPCH